MHTHNQQRKRHFRLVALSLSSLNCARKVDIEMALVTLAMF
jgi:hypothetical protein